MDKQIKTRKPWYGSVEWLTQIVMADNLYTDPSEATPIVEDLQVMHPSLRPHFLKWAETGEVPASLEVREFSIEKIIKLQPGFAVTGAFGLLDFFIKDYDQAKELVWRTPILPFGFLEKPLSH